MTVERLQIGLGEMSYHAMGPAEHLARYMLLRQICRGKSILDVACGEGYGCYLLSQWGAASVLGIGISSEGIAKAKTNFPAKNVTYTVGNVCELDCIIPASSRYDIVFSFGTIEHLGDAGAFLREIAKLRSDLVVVGADNDPKESEKTVHERRCTFESFKASTEAVLGPATKWLLGISIQGYALISEDAGLVMSADADVQRAVQDKDVNNLHLVPAQENVTFWLGVWGELNDDAAVVQPASRSGFLETRQSVEFFNQKIGRLEKILAEERRVALAARKRVAELEEERRVAFALRTRLAEFESGARLTPECIRTIAQEVWYESQRRGLPYKISKWFKTRLVSRD